MAEVVRWVRSQGGQCAKLEVKAQDGGERAVVANSALKAGEEAFTLPFGLWLTAASLQDHEAGRVVLAWAASNGKASGAVRLPDEHLEMCLLAVLLLLEKRARSSKWSEYVASLPWNSIDHLPLTWTLERLSSQLQGSAPQQGIEAKRQQLTAAYASLCGSCTKDAHAEFVGACADAQAFIQAFALVHSRSMHAPSKDSNGRSWKLALLPLADMLNHSSQPPVVLEVEEGRQVVGRMLRDAPAGAEVFQQYQGAATAQAFFATYGFIENVAEATPTELFPAWEKTFGAEHTCIRLSSCRSIRRFLSRLRVAIASDEERKALDKKAGPSDAARQPISARNEREAMEQLRSHLAARARLGQETEAAVEKKQGPHGGHLAEATKALRAADATGWVRLGRLAIAVLAHLDAGGAGGRELSTPQLAVELHRATREIVLGSSAASAAVGHSDGEAMTLRECGGNKGRGFFAAKKLKPGHLLLVEEPFIFDANDDDFAAIAAAHVLGIVKEVELRPDPNDAEEHEDRDVAGQWLRGMKGVSWEQAAKAFSAAKNNGFQTTMPAAPEEEPMLLFRKLCMFNHSCIPNCSVYRDNCTGTARVLVIRPVDPGTELTIHYSDELVLLPTQLRHRFIQGRFGFECRCGRCSGNDPSGMMVEAALGKTADGTEDPAKRHVMQMAHRDICRMQMAGGVAVGFGYGQQGGDSFDDWAQALAAVEAVMPHIAAYGAETFWARHHARELKCLALEGLGRDVPAFLALAEHCAAAWRLLPPFCDGLQELNARLGTVRARLPPALGPKLEEKAMQSHGNALSGLAKDLEMLKGWLRSAGIKEAASPASAPQGIAEAALAAPKGAASGYPAEQPPSAPEPAEVAGQNGGGGGGKKRNKKKGK
eukprot:CAMPEP_0203927450 /NCGR_PEP_ID=MMETSP0359-20131031/66863_1 /ASSEMBLY_ACC=CAM_ASM_000338 /TAXON_ID=268821 /ORGANISM="Scrippsiella Hangoei, Strain SHTV-5" /LENGTH=881 /DNA_ID=CAMNT_0050856221 /DNA_START=44 /DNA_END=2689 /DNA_ORIENTATION=+